MSHDVADRVRTFIRTGEPQALSKRSVRVPREDAREKPVRESRLASQYLLDESRLTRRETTIDLYLSDVGGRTLEVECSLPNEGCGTRIWYLPLAFLTKKDVAPNLEVMDGEGKVMSVPTKHQNLAMTKQAINDLAKRGNLQFGPRRAYRKLVDEVIEKRPVPARVSRMVYERSARGPALKAVPLLRLLEDNFVLWVPVEGDPGSHHHFRITRQEIRHPDQIIVRGREEKRVSFSTALGSQRVRGYSATARWPAIRWRAAIERLLKAFALRPIETRLRDREASRACSSHLRLHAPPGFQVRNVRVAEILPTGQSRRLREMDPLEKDVAIQGWDQKLGHVHLSKTRNPQDVYCRMTLGLRGGTNTLWMLATVLTAALLWVVQHHSRYGPATSDPGQFEFVRNWFSAAENRKHLSISPEDKQIVAAALLVGPAFASAWALRAESGELLRSFLSGSRVLLLLSSVLSVLAALALANVLPTNLGRYTAVEVYAALSYFVAVPMMAAWILSLRPTWEFFRKILKTERRNLVGIAVLGGPVLLLATQGSLPLWAAGALVIGAGFGLAAIAANSVAERLHYGSGATHFRPLAGFGSVPIFVFGGPFLGFFTELLSVETARAGCVVWGGAVGTIAAVLAFFTSD